mmetsp:Transcript_9152/g.26583  ORF Transcript_9152/g.26583 Transcript_9152/m.26583 type:complete len:212 (+) Transcript_9152:392-1027(+)
MGELTLPPAVVHGAAPFTPSGARRTARRALQAAARSVAPSPGRRGTTAGASSGTFDRREHAVLVNLEHRAIAIQELDSLRGWVHADDGALVVHGGPEHATQAMHPQLVGYRLCHHLARERGGRFQISVQRGEGIRFGLVNPGCAEGDRVDADVDCVCRRKVVSGREFRVDVGPWQGHGPCARGLGSAPLAETMHRPEGCRMLAQRVQSCKS